MRLLVFLYGVISYVLFLAVFLYAIAFVGGITSVGGFEIPKTLNDGEVVGLPKAMLINAVLFGMFALQHTVMARPGFKAWWTKIIPAAAERSTFVLVTNVLFAVLYWQWRPMPDLVWSVGGTLASVLWALFWAGWGIVLLATFMINHFDLFGMRQVTLFLQGREYTPAHYVERFFYRYVRHPLMLGFLVAFWAAPEMSQGRLLFAGMTTAYVLVALHIEERDLVKSHGDSYRNYQSRVPMLLPIPKRKKG
jgi:protein-S-isoprenylcysteine O-methyltransferase Ste14